MGSQEKYSIQLKLPNEVRGDVKQTIALRVAAEIPRRMELSLKNAIAIFGLGGLIFLVWTASGAPPSATFWILQLGVPAAVVWFNTAAESSATKLEFSHQKAIECEEWTKALRAHGLPDDYPT